MVSQRCTIVVRNELEKLSLEPISVELGMVELPYAISDEQKEKLSAALKLIGLQIIEDKKTILVEKIKNIIIQMVHYEYDSPQTKFSVFLSRQLYMNYNYLAALFSSIEGCTIEHFIIHHKIEKAKAMIADGEHSFSDIAFQLHYSSVAHFSAQFKKVTGLNPSAYRSGKTKVRTPLEAV